jgi:hypothetical protein
MPATRTCDADGTAAESNLTRGSPILKQTLHSEAVRPRSGFQMVLVVEFREIDRCLPVHAAQSRQRLARWWSPAEPYSQTTEREL